MLVGFAVVGLQSGENARKATEESPRYPILLEAISAPPKIDG
jgi:hypothetical protein